MNARIGASRGQKDESGPLELLLLAAQICPVWVLGNNLMSSGEASALNRRAISPAPTFILLTQTICRHFRGVINTVASAGESLSFPYRLMDGIQRDIHCTSKKQSAEQASTERGLGSEPGWKSRKDERSGEGKRAAGPELGFAAGDLMLPWSSRKANRGAGL